jgi:hypothetical protein
VGEAFTVRMRTSAGLHSLWLAPAGGMGLSFPCCAYGHELRDAALLCGVKRLEEKFLGVSPATSDA